MESKADTTISVTENQTPPKKSNLKIILIIATTIIAIYFLFFHLWGDNQIAYDLIVENSYYFNSPTSVRIVSGTAGDSNETGKYAFVCLKAKNAYGVEGVGHYSLKEGYEPNDFESGIYSDEGLDGYHLDNSYFLKLCRENKLNVWKINFRLWIYWTF